MADATEDLTKIAEEARERALLDDVNDQLKRANEVYQLWWCWADFELFIINPSIEPIIPPLLIMPEVLPDSGSKEFVYPIYDYGYKLITSKSEDMYTSGKSMCKLYYTIEKMIYLLIERLKTGGISTETEVQIALNGFEKALRKAFESVINLKYNVVITNFDPGAWGENYLEIVKRLADKGYGYPPEAPRDSFRQTHTPQLSPR